MFSNISQSRLEHQHTRLFVYGSLAPRQTNHYLLKNLRGSWSSAQIKADFVRILSGSDRGYWALIPGEKWVHGYLFTSTALPLIWPKLDAFEGPSYQRLAQTIYTHRGIIEAQTYYLVSEKQGLSVLSQSRHVSAIMRS